MTDTPSEFERLVSALRPWLAELVVVGGWAHRIHHQHPLAVRTSYAPITTRDADLAFGTDARLRGRLSTALAEAGFHEVLSNEETPPIAQYHLGTDDEGFYVEFLAPLRGSAVRRDGRDDSTLSRGGVTAQKLRHVDLLLLEPWTIRLGGMGSRFLPETADVRIAHPVTFVVQKLLIHGARRPDKQAQDVLYIHDTVQLFASSIEQLRTQWKQRIAPALSTVQRETVNEARARIFGQVSDTIRAAARIPLDRVLQPESLRAACAEGLQRILDSA